MSIRRPLAAVLGLLAFSVAVSAEAQETVRIGYQKSSTLITLLKTQGTLEKALKADNIDVSWHEFPSGLPLLEALNVGNVDISADVADTVPIFAQAAQAKLTYFAQEAPSPSAQAIVVRKDSPIQQLSDLKGKKIGVQRGSIHDRFAKEVLAPKGATVVPYSSQNEIYLDVEAGRLDGTVADATLLQDGFLKTPAGKGYAFVGPQFTDAKYFGDGIGIAVRKGDKAELDKINAAIAAIRANGKYKQIQDKYFDFDIYGADPK